MGYRSDVAIGFLFESKDKMMAFVVAYRLAGDQHTVDALKEYRVTDNLMHVQFLNVKWYESYLDVIAHTQLLSSAQEQGISTAFVRLGEEHDDTECDIICTEHPQDYDTLSELFAVSRSMTCPQDGEPLVAQENQDELK